MQLEIGNTFRIEKIYKAVELDSKQLKECVLTAATCPVVDIPLMKEMLRATRHLYKDKEFVKKCILAKYKDQFEGELAKMLMEKQVDGQ